jgi:hypothetical protein
MKTPAPHHIKPKLQNQINALNDSIEHWEDNVYYANYQEFNFVRTGAMSCRCCQYWFEDNCDGCPIKEFTGAIKCRNTPYQKAALLYSTVHKSVEEDESIIGNFILQFRAAAQVEVDFLKGVRDGLVKKLNELE